jgi:hypothetical protein
MSNKKKVLLQLDGDRFASSFDSLVAIDAGADVVLPYAGIQPFEVAGIVHGGMFTRGLADLANTAIFIGGSQVEPAERLLDQVKKTFFGPFRVSVLIDPNGANTTSAAAVLSAAKHLALAGSRSLIFGGTGPVGSRVARLLVHSGGHVTIASRQRERAQEICDSLEQIAGRKCAQAFEWSGNESGAAAADLLATHQLIFSAGAAGVQFLTPEWLQQPGHVKVAIDLNAVPPLGLGGIEPQHQANSVGDVLVYGAIGVGGLKMKIHRRCIQQLFTANTHVLDTLAIYELGQQLVAA